MAVRAWRMTKPSDCASRPQSYYAYGGAVCIGCGLGYPARSHIECGRVIGAVRTPARSFKYEIIL